jgi:ABC-type branched-subunit amino acid transport system ATPase component/MFS family permease
MSDIDEALGAVAPRVMVPSAREVVKGQADYSFEPLPPPPPLARVPLRQRLGDAKTALDPRLIGAGYPALPLVLLGLDALFSRWDDVAFAILLPDIKDHFGFDLGFLLSISATVAVLSTVLSPVTGFLADRLPRVRMLAAGNIVQNAASMVAGQAPTVTALGLAKGAGGLGQAVSQPTILPLLADWYPAERRARLMAFITMIAGIGAIVAPLVAGALGQIIGWRLTLTILGGVATAIALCFLRLREPVRGGLDRKAMGASDEVAQEEQPPVSWAEGLRATSSVATLRRIWYATPFMVAGASVQTSVMPIYYSEEFGLGSFGRGVVVAIGTAFAVLVLPFAGPVVDRLLARRPGQVFASIGAVLVVGAVATLVLAVSPALWLSVLVTLPVAALGLLTLPALATLQSLVLPARIRALGIATLAPWQLLGQLFVIVVVNSFNLSSARVALAIMVPVGLLAALLIGSGGAAVERDMRAARAASMADEEARRARSAGANKMIVCRDVDVSYDGAQVLFNVDFDVEEGELVALLGTNGAGKSTLLRAIAGIQQASNGAIFLDGQDITHRPPHQNARGGIVFMPGGKAVFPSLTVRENLRTAAWMDRDDEAGVAARTEEVLDLFPVLRDRLDQPTGTMSGGEQQMVGLGQAFLMKPRLLMIDELSLGLAPAVVERLLDIVRQVNAQGTTVILVEQSANVALTIARRAVFMEKGEIRFDGSLQELLGRGDLLRSVFLGGVGGGAGGALVTGGSGLRRPGRDEEQGQVLAVDDIHLSFGGHRALDGAHLEVAGSQIVGIIGPNGAGKTTLFDVISGHTEPESGRVLIAGSDAGGLSPDARARLGLSRSFQNARLFPTLTTRENIAVALELQLKSRSTLASAAWLPAARRSEQRAARRVEYLVDLLQLEAYADKFIAELSTGSRRLVDLACVIASEPRILLLDEPSSGLAQSEVEVLGPVVRRLAKETGCGILVIEHDMPLITALADHLIAMELGRVLLEGRPADIVSDPRVVQSYLGTADAATTMRSGSFLASALAVVSETTT